MLESSQAIQPKEDDQEAANRSRVEEELGAVTSYSIKKDTVRLICTNGLLDIYFYEQPFVRILARKSKLEERTRSFAIVNQAKGELPTIEENSETIELRGSLISIIVKKNPVRLIIKDQHGRVLVEEKQLGLYWHGREEVACYKEMKQGERFYGFGEKTSFLDKRGEKMTMWNTDVYAPHNPQIDALYQSVPFYVGLSDEGAYGLFFDNTHKTTFDLKSSQNTLSFSAEAGLLDYYVFAGPTMKDVLQQYTFLTGTTPLPPKWALGYHQSRFSYETDSEVRDMIATFREKDIPLDAIYLDIHYMDEFRVFTFDKKRFPNPKKLINDAKEAGVRVIPIVDPGVKWDLNFSVFKDGIKNNLFCKYIDGQLFSGDVWPGKSVFPVYTKMETKKWWGDLHTYYTDMGIEGIWNDMNEPAVFTETMTMDLDVLHENDGDPRSHKELHNVYGLLMGEATYEGLEKQLNGKRPFILTRAGFSGVQRYAAVWTGDNRSFWEHLQMSIPMCLNLGMSGIAFCGTDVGGFAHDTTGELLARWTQVGAFTPFFRNHSADRTIRQEPWSFGQQIEDIVKKYIEVRYRFLPYMYQLFHETSKSGIPIMRPLILEYPNDKKVENCSDQFLVGSDLLVAPIMTPETTHRAVYLPEGRWFDYWTGKQYVGGQHHLIYAPLDTLPLFVREGAILPLGKVKTSTEVKDEMIEFHLYGLQSEGSYTYYEDDEATVAYQDGCFVNTNLHYTFEENTLSLTLTKSGDESLTVAQKKLIIHNTSNIKKVIVNGKEKDFKQNKDGQLVIHL